MIFDRVSTDRNGVTINIIKDLIEREFFDALRARDYILQLCYSIA